ncbi:MAG: beta-galactosidase trimerization domain-containing protein [Spirochaetota bacterium]
MPNYRIQPIAHDFLIDRYLAVNGSERQQQIRRIAPMPFGAVLITRDDMTESDIRNHLRTMKKLGFNAIKQFMSCDRWSDESLERMALEEGLVPWWYGEGGWEPLDDDLCRRLGVDPELPVSRLRSLPEVLEHQNRVLSERFGRKKIRLNVESQVGMFAQEGGTSARTLGTDAELPEHVFPIFLDWLRRHYGNDIRALNRAWNCDGSYAGDPTRGYASFEEIPFDAATSKREYRRIRDILRFKADAKLEEIEALCRRVRERDPFEPHRSGGEMGIFLPFASRGTDMEGIARALKDTGSFYPSIHLCWHFEETWFEVARPVYMQASFVVDLNKGGWTAPWESTGGPQQTSGAKAYLYPRVEDLQPGFTVDAGVMTQLLLSYLAAGCKGAGLWSWNARMAGHEAGEYALLDRNEEVCARTVRAGAIARAANRFRDELWNAFKEPQVGILMDWNNEAIWAAMSQKNRTLFKYVPIEARIGACRTCIDAGIPFEYVTAENVRQGLAGRYETIFFPGGIALDEELLSLLQEYVSSGGRLVVDMPAGCYDATGRVLSTAVGTPFERLFGVKVSDIQYSGNNVVRELAQSSTVETLTLKGYTADLIPTNATVNARYDNGNPAVTEHAIGSGTAVVLGWEAARSCYMPGQQEFQRVLSSVLLSGRDPYYRFESEAVCYRLAAPDADHWFFVNDGPATSGYFSLVPREYAGSQDVLTGEQVDISAPFSIEADGGRWIRCEVTAHE